MAKNSTEEFKAVILAGGSGERFWPLSTAEKPKQFLKVFGGESLLLVDTVESFLKGGAGND